MKKSWLLLSCVLIPVPTQADFVNSSPMEVPQKPNVPTVIHSPGKSGIIGFCFSWMRTMAEGGPEYVTLYEVVIRSTKDGHLVKRVKNKVGYKFNISLPPGIYSVQAIAPFRDSDSHHFNIYSLKQIGRVKPNQFRKVVLQFGI